MAISTSDSLRVDSPQVFEPSRQKTLAGEAAVKTAVAVLASGGLDSAILAADLAGRGIVVHPLYVRHGYYWEDVELAHLREFLAAVDRPTMQELKIIELPLTDVVEGDHWSVTGQNVPDENTLDEAVFLPGRNVLLLAKAMLWCHLRGLRSVALATLHSNPFPDATDSFFESFRDVVNQAVAGQVEVLRPYGELTKPQVMERGRGLPLELTFSCLRPVKGRHCGRCNKCEERRLAFAKAEMEDRTHYASRESYVVVVGC